ncbi:MAG: Rrf2 family transcriptional regulator [Pirellulales bacterium]|nr:Rrf2 family transcriptional regulator [Pirellulales bacterium]
MISQTAEYALRAITFLASQNGTPRTTAQIAAHTQVPRGYLAKVMQSLGRAGLVHSQRGSLGGFVLAVDPGSLDIFRVISAVEPSRRARKNPLGSPEQMEMQPLNDRLDRAAEQIEETLRQTTVQELISREKGSASMPPDSVADA